MLYDSDWKFVDLIGSSIAVPSNAFFYTTTDGRAISTSKNDIFYNGKGLLLTENPNKVRSSFKGCRTLKSITIPNGVTEIEAESFYNCNSLTDINIPNSVTAIKEKAFENCSSLTSITIPNSVTYIDDRVFYGCVSLTNLIIPNSVETINSRAFYNCTGLKSLTISDNTTSIASDTFGCDETSDGSTFHNISNVIVKISNLAEFCNNEIIASIHGSIRLYINGKEATSIAIPNGVSSIGCYAFSDCRNLKSVTIPNSVTSIEECAFRDCTSLGSIIIPNNVTTIGSSAFSGCKNLKSVTIGSSVTTIDSYAFCDCVKLTGLVIPNSVEVISDGAFYNCRGLQNLTITETTTSIADDAFGYDVGEGWETHRFNNITVKISDLTKFCENSPLCNNLYGPVRLFYKGKEIVNLIIPNDVTYISGAAFYDCRNLQSVTIPNSVESIDNQAFYNCMSLRTVYCTSYTPPTLGKDVFNHDDGRIGCTIYVPSSSLNTYEYADVWNNYYWDIRSM